MIKNFGYYPQHRAGGIDHKDNNKPLKCNDLLEKIH